jgi:protein-tyrosine phosphatase
MSEPKPDFKFRSGKYLGKTYEWVCDNHPSYIAWVKENQPNMLKEKVTTIKDVKNEGKEFGKLEFNKNFDNEGPAWYCIPYLEKMKRESESDEDEYNF